MFAKHRRFPYRNKARRGDGRFGSNVTDAALCTNVRCQYKAVKNRHLDASQTEVSVPSEAVWTMLRTQCFELNSTSSIAAPMVTVKELMRNIAFRRSAFLASLFPVWLRTRKNEMIPPVATSQVPRAVACDVKIKVENDAKNLKNQKIVTRKPKITAIKRM